MLLRPPPPVPGWGDGPPALQCPHLQPALTAVMVHQRRAGQLGAESICNVRVGAVLVSRFYLVVIFAGNFGARQAAPPNKPSWLQQRIH